MKCFAIFALSMASAASAASADNRKTEILNIVKQGVRNLQDNADYDYVTDKTASCYGESFDSITLRSYDSVTSSGDFNEAIFVGKCTNAIKGNTYTCDYSCDTTTGTVVAVVLTSPDDSVTATTDITTDTRGAIGENGCTGGFSLTVTASQNANLFVQFSGTQGMSNGKVTCTEKCATGFQAVYSKMSSIILGLAGGGRRLQKYVRGGAGSK